MKQIRFITHDDSHVDEETLFGDVWAVTRCDCKLETKEIDMKRHHGQSHLRGGFDPAKYGIKTELVNPCACGMFEIRVNGMCRVCDADMRSTADIIVYHVKPALNDLLTLLSIVDETSGEISEPAQLPVSIFAMSPRVGDEDGCGNDSDLHAWAMGG